MSWGELLSGALAFQVEKHQGVFRDGDAPVPYACHPVEVMLFLRHIGGVTREEALAAALLHDTVEDTDATLEEISGLFGPVVAELVGEVTRDEPTEEERAGLSKEEVWEMRTRLLIEEIGRMSDDAKRIKLSDRLSNIRESKKTRKGWKLERYEKQTYLILAAIPEKVSPALWKAVRAEV